MPVRGLSHDGAHVAWERQLAPHVALQVRGFIRSLVVYHDPLLCLHLDNYLPHWFIPSMLPNAPLHEQLAELTLKEYRPGNRSGSTGSAGVGDVSIGSDSGESRWVRHVYIHA